MSELSIGYAHTWNIMDKKDMHLLRTVPIIEAEDLLKYINDSVLQGNIEGSLGFSAALFLSELIKKLEKEITEWKEKR